MPAIEPWGYVLWHARSEAASSGGRTVTRVIACTAHEDVAHVAAFQVSRPAPDAFLVEVGGAEVGLRASAMGLQEGVARIV